MPETDGSARGVAPNTRSVLLGIFIVWQLAFLVVHNLVGLLQEARADMPAEIRAAVEQVAPGWPEKKGHVWNLMEGATNVTNRWSQVTWQLQTWALFAPNVGKDCVFPALVLSEEAPTNAPLARGDLPATFQVPGKLVLSDNEPPDMKRFFRWGNFRLRRFENNLVIYLLPWEPETPQETAERFRKRIKEHLTENPDMLVGYLRFRLNQLDGPPPPQVILLLRRYHLTGPGAGSDFVEGPFTVPIARWHPGAEQDSGHGLEYFNPVTQRFEPL
jgi:hypothetical protein